MTQQEPPSDQTPSSSPQPAPPPVTPRDALTPQRQMKLANLLVIAFIAYAAYHYFTDPKEDTAPQGSVTLQKKDTTETPRNCL